MHHVFARGNDRREIFDDESDRWMYVRTLARAVARMRWRCLAYCLMDNHVHLLIETPHGNLGAGMQRLHGDYAQAYNERHGRSGHVFQGRYGATRVRTEEHMLMVVAYIVRNPVEAGLCSRPEEWRWSSHRAVVDQAAPAWLDVERLLWYLGSRGGDPRRRYAELTAGPLG